MCPSCFKNKGIKHSVLGLLPCKSCQTKHNTYPSPSQPIEIIPERIKAERIERADSIEQPHVKGELNKRYLDLWGEDIVKKKGFTDKDIKNAKYHYDKLRTKNTAVRYYKDST